MKNFEKASKTLEFDKILQMLSECAQTDAAKLKALTLTPETEIDRIKRKQEETAEAKRLAGLKGVPSFYGVVDISDQVERACKGAQLTPGELLTVARVLTCARTLKNYPHTDHDDGYDPTNPFYVYFSRLTAEPDLERSITQTILADDLIADDASPELSNIRRKIKTVNNKVKETLQKFITGNHYQKYLQENIITTRQGRYVIPVKIEYRNEIKGLVHDTSASGATLFIEPAAVVEANNELRLLERDEEREIEKILYALSARVSDASGILSLDFYNITQIALIFAKAELSYRIDGCTPVVTEEKKLRILRARHPLLDKHTVVPTDILLGGDFDVLVITGPNTGGKTVCLKTLGLLSMMVQAGLQPSCSGLSVFPVFEEFCADIGDEQSIEQSLSTFSAHMKNIVGILEDTDDRSLVLFDELGAGTDPIEGAALAIAVLEEVHKRGALCAATTHYAELKAYALETPGICNGCCEFDVETLAPTYHLIIGTPGKSNAFAISEKLGLPKEIVGRAKELVSSDNAKFELVIEQLEQLRLRAEKTLAETLREKEEFEAYKKEAGEKIAKSEAEADKALQRAKDEATSILKSAKVTSDFVLGRVEEAKKSAEVSAARSDIRRALKEADDEINPVTERKPEEGYVLPRPLKKGDRVLIFSLGKKATVAEPADKSGNIKLLVGNVNFRTKTSNLKLLEEDKEEKEEKSTASTATGTAAHFSPEIDLRGELADDAWYLLDKYLDSALVVKMPSVRVIHGKGTGALRKRIWQELKNDKRVSSFRSGTYGEGDTGVTIAVFR